MSFWATRPGTPERKAEEEIARARGLKLRECKPIEGFAYAALPALPALHVGLRMGECLKAQLEGRHAAPCFACQLIRDGLAGGRP